MLTNIFVALLFFHLFSMDIILSVSTIINILFSGYYCVKNSPENHIFKLVLIYLLGFGLFVCGRFFSNLFSQSDTFCLEFGFYYCLSDEEKIKSIFLINLALVFFTYGFLNNVKKTSDNNIILDPNTNTLFILSVISPFLGGYSLYSSYLLISKAISEGYMSIFESQDGVYSSSLGLIVFTLFVSMMAIQYVYKEKYKFCLIFFRLNVFIYLLIMLSSVLQGSRSGFIAGLFFVTWLYLQNKKIHLKHIFFVLSIFLLMFFANDLASLSGARQATSDNDFFLIILEDIFYNQGTTMMVFNMGVLNDSYPILAYLKVLIPGIQIFYSFFYDIYNYNLTFSNNLLYRLSPSTFSQGFGLGWSLLGDFYAFSFGFLPLFLLFNYYWGVVLYKISDRFNHNGFFQGLFICFLTQIFMLNRASISGLWALVIFYTIIYFLISLKSKK